MSSPRVPVAMIGLGRMGGPMADGAIRAGHDVRVFDVAADAVAPRRAAGARACRSVAEACDGALVVSVVVFDDVQVLEVVAGSGGVFDAAPSGAVVLIHTTVTLDTIETLAAEAAERGLRLLDAGISGGESGAAAGTLVVMVGGEAEALAIARPVLDSYSAEVVHAGGQGAGMALKLARNAVGYIMMAAAHEALCLATAAGVAGDTLRHVLEVTDLPAMLYTPFALGGPEPLPDDAPDDTRTAMDHVVRLGRKDLAQALALADRHGIAMPAAIVAREELAEVMRVGRH
jgi:3-hydroxyisobutyrate dehydrogenase-like beta-hydroxyacid dehydrogenase